MASMDEMTIPPAKDEEQSPSIDQSDQQEGIRQRRADTNNSNGQARESGQTQKSSDGDFDNIEGEPATSDEYAENLAANKKDDDINNVAAETMTENVFSLVYTAPVNSSAFWLGIFVSIFQIAMPSLALLDLVIFSDRRNPLQVPNGVSIQVRIIGAMALVLGVAQFWDFMEALEKLEKGPPPDSVYTLPGASRWKFYLAYILQFIMGTLFHISVFTLVVQSTTVVEMFMNFAALEFICTVDDVTFALAKRGYFTNSIKEYCDVVSDTVILRQKGGRVSRRVQIFIIAAFLLSMYGLILYQEETGRFHCTQVEAQFGDGFITLMQVFSGIYYYERDFHDDRPVYWDKDHRAAFRYCANGEGMFHFAETGFWVFNIISDEVPTIEDMCNNYYTRSPDTKGYDLLETPATNWLAKHRVEDTVEYDVDYFSLRCADCDPSTCNGKCVKGKCECHDNGGRFGSHCQFTDVPCEETDYDRRTSPFSGAGLAYSSDYYLLHKSNGLPAFSYHRPIYYFINQKDEIDILMNLGRRYFMFYLNATLIDGFDNFTDDKSVLAEYLENVHPFYDWIYPIFVKGEKDSNPFHVPVFVSDPIDIGTATDNVSPLGLSWARVNQLQLDKENYWDIFLIGGQIDTVLLCASCSRSSPCLTGGVCDANHTCHCTHGHVGRLCESDCWEHPTQYLCPRCFTEHKTDSTCEACYADSKAMDCPDCKTDPFASDCIDCYANSTDPGCKSELRDQRPPPLSN